MTRLRFRCGGVRYLAEVLVGADLNLDEILAVHTVTRLGVEQEVTDWSDLEEVIESALADRAERVSRKKTVDFVPDPVVECPLTVETGDNPEPHTDINHVPSQETTIMATFTRKSVHEKTGRITYAYGRSTIKFAPSMFEGEAPETIEVSGPFAGPKAKLTKDERKALVAAMTPEEKAQAKLAAARKQIANAQARAAKLEAALAL